MNEIRSARGAAARLSGRKGEAPALVAVKRHTSLLAALEIVAFDQRRLRRGGANLAARRPGLAGASVRLDVMALAPSKLPRHIPDAWRGE